jgi:RNA polymerase sigma-70 factor (ECF subfamily)
MFVNELGMTAEEFKNRIIPFTGKLYPMVKRILGNEEESRDVLQELMIKFWNIRHVLEHCQNPGGYMAAMAKNFCFDMKKKRKIHLVDQYETIHESVPAIDQDHDVSEKMENIHRIIGNLPEKYREILQYREIDGFSYDEIHELTGLEMAHIRVLLSRARTKVKEEMDKIYNYERIGCEAAG